MQRASLSRIAPTAVHLPPVTAPEPARAPAAPVAGDPARATATRPDALSGTLARAVLQRDLGYHAETIAPFLIKPGENTNPKTGERIWVPVTSMTSGPLAETLQAPKNPNTSFDAWLYHVTTLGNLVGVQTSGLDPSLGGRQKGGSCWLATDEELKQTSIKFSTNVVSAGVDRGTIASYLGQKEKFIEDQERALATERSMAAGKPDPRGVPEEWAPVLLRFRNRREWEGRWRRDPDDQRAWQLQDTTVPAHAIECLQYEGWVPLASLDLSWVTVTETEAERAEKLILYYLVIGGADQSPAPHQDG
jgi:hypothetical protein